jgi:hypothetical protein
LKTASKIDINSEHIIGSATVYISGSSGNDTSPTLLNPANFDENLKRLWERLMPNCLITFDNLEIITQDGKGTKCPGQLVLLLPNSQFSWSHAYPEPG